MPDIWLYGTGWVLRGNWGTYCDRGGFLFRNSLRSSSATKSLSVSRQTGESVPGRSHSRHLHKLPPTHTHRDTHTQLEWLSIARHVEQQCSSGWRLRCRKISSGKRQSRFCPCLCVSQCVCVSEMLFARFQFPQSFHQGKRPRKRPRYACPDSRYDTIYIHIRYIAMHNMFFVIVFLFFLCGETLRR